jgi:hypothetical protein
VEEAMGWMVKEFDERWPDVMVSAGMAETVARRQQSSCFINNWRWLLDSPPPPSPHHRRHRHYIILTLMVSIHSQTPMQSERECTHATPVTRATFSKLRDLKAEAREDERREEQWRLDE